jgi:hypothetical protein
MQTNNWSGNVNMCVLHILKDNERMDLKELVRVQGMYPDDSGLGLRFI